MNTKKILIIAGGIIAIVATSIGATLAVQSVQSHPAPLPPAQATPTPPPPPPAPTPTVPATPVAQVIAVSPHYVTVSKPVQHCYPVQQVVSQPASPKIPGAGAVIGGVAGGFAGSAIKGNAHTAAIVAGAALGALSGNAVQKSMNQPTQQVQTSTQCSTQNVSKQVVKGYDVTYLMNGQQGTTRMNTAPAVGSNLILPQYQTQTIQVVPTTPAAPTQ